MSETPHDPTQALQAAARYWDEQDARSIKLDPADVRATAEAYLRSHNTCALATSNGDYVRCTPIEYSYHDGCFWMFSEGGKKFIGLAKNSNVSLAVYDPYQGFGKLRSVQVTGRAELVEPFSPRYQAHAAFRKIPLDSLRKLPSPMHLICVHPTRMDCLFSEFKEKGGSARQTLLFSQD